MVNVKNKMCALLIIIILCMSGGASIVQAAVEAVIDGYKYTSVNTGLYYSAAIRNDGTLWEWGDGVNTPQRNYDLNDVVSVVQGYYYKLALLKDGTVWAWGNNSKGQLGIGTNDYSYQPTQVIGLSGVVAVFCNSSTSAALRNDGTLWIWGDNSKGLLGNGYMSNSNTYYEKGKDSNIPVQVNGLNYVVSFDLKWSGCIAACKDGSVWSWGRNYYSGENYIDTLFPERIASLNDIKQVSTGYNCNMVLTNGGSVYSWGSNNMGQLGLGEVDAVPTPALIPGLTNVKKIDCDGSYAIALKNDGTVWGWGYRYEPEIEYSNIPVRITDTDGIKDISLSSHILLVGEDGSVWTKGCNNQGQLGDGSIVSKNYFVRALTQEVRSNILVKILDTLSVNFSSITVSNQIYNPTVTGQIYNLSYVTATSQISSPLRGILKGKTVYYSVLADGVEISSGKHLITDEQYSGYIGAYFNVPVTFVVNGTKYYTVKSYLDGDNYAQDVKRFYINVATPTPTPTGLPITITLSPTPTPANTLVPTSTPTSTVTPTPNKTKTKRKGGGGGGAFIPSFSPTPTLSAADQKENSESIVDKNVPLADSVSHWARVSINKLIDKKILNGYPDGTFKPDNTITRAEVAVVIVKMLGLTPSEEKMLNFVDSDEIPGWAKAYVKTAVDKGIIKGYKDNTFKPQNNITRQEMAVIIANTLSNVDTSNADTSFRDDKEIASWARSFVAKASGLKIINGYPKDNTFRPLNSITRAEVAAIVSKTLEVKH